MRVEKAEMIRVLHAEPTFGELFIAMRTIPIYFLLFCEWCERVCQARASALLTVIV